MSDLINRQDAIRLAEQGQIQGFEWQFKKLCTLPSAQPEPAIPLSWIEGQIKWLKSLDNAFSTLTAVQISAMVNKWRGEQDEID
jgi:hypothetical protein